MNLKERSEMLIVMGEAHLEQPDAYLYLPEIIETLKAMQAGMDSAEIDEETKSRWVRGLGRLVTENYIFSESELGSMLLDFITEYRAEIQQVD